MADEYTRYTGNGASEGPRGGLVALAIIAAAVGAGAALLLAPETGVKTRKRVGRLRRKRHQSRRDGSLMGLAGLLVGAGLAAVLTPESGPATRERLGSTWNRIKVGAVDRIDRLRAGREADEPGVQSESVRTVQELGRDADSVF